MQMIGRKPQDLAFSPSEFERYRSVLDKYIENPTLAVDFRDDIKKIDVSKLTRGLKTLNNGHYEQLAALYDEQKKAWAKIRAQHPPMRLTSRDMTAAAVMFAINPALGALVALPYALDRLIRLHNKIEAANISKEITQLKAEITRNNRRKDALKELYQSQRQFKEEIVKMRKEEREIIRSNVSKRINVTAKKDKNFINYVDYINQSKIRDVQPTYDELASMYQRDVWRNNNDAVLRGTDVMLDAAATATSERPEMRAVYILPMIFDIMARTNADDRIDGQMLERVINDFRQIAPQYVKAELTAEQKEEQELLRQTRERNDNLRNQIRKQDIVDRPLPEVRPNKITGKVSLSKEDYDYLANVFNDYRHMREVYNEAQSEKYYDAQEIKKLHDKIKELDYKLSDNQSILNNLSKRCKALEGKNAELSADMELIETYINENGLDKSVAEWIEAREAIKDAAQAIQRQYDGMEM